MGLEHPMTTIRKNKQIKEGPYKAKPTGPKPIRIIAAQEDPHNA